MGTPTGRQSSQGELLSYVVGQSVSRSHGLRGQNDLSFVLAWAGAHPIVSTQVFGAGAFTAPAASPATIPVIYARNPGVQVLMIEARPQATSAGGYGTLTVTAATGSVTWISAGGLDGTATITGSVHETINVPVLRGFLDVSALTVGTPIELRFTSASTSNFAGYEYIHAIEVPLVASDPVGAPSTEVGLDSAWPSTNGFLVDGSATASPRGMQRWAAQMDLARASVKRHIQVATYDDNSGPWQSASGVATTFEIIKVRARRLYSTSTPNACLYIVTYRTSTGATAGEATLSDGTTTVTLSLPASTTRTTAQIAFPLTCAGTDQEADLTITYRRASGAGTVYFSNFCLLENES